MSLAKDPLHYFRIESREISQELGRGTLQLEKGLAPGLIARLLRLAHTLKGAAAVVKQTAIVERAHALEGLLAPLRDREGAVTRQEFEPILVEADAIASQVAALAAAPSKGADPTPRAAQDETVTFVGTDAAEMDALLQSVAETDVHLRALRATAALAEQARHLADRIADRDQGDRQGAARTHVLAEELRDTVGHLEKLVKGGIDGAERELQQARVVAERLRLLPCSAMLSQLERAARDFGRSIGKEVSFEARGADVRLGTDVLTLVQRALVQLIRNAVAHGLETGEARQSAGKPRAGRIEIDIMRRGERVAFICRDDGRGIDMNAVRRAAHGRGAAPTQIEGLGPEALLALLLKGGITTSGTVTELSGRGVGLDIVREVAQRLGAEVSARTEAGQGTAIELVVPVSLSSLEALLVRSGGTVSAIPLDAVRGVRQFSPNEISRASEGDTISHEGKIVPFVPLARSLKRVARTEQTGQSHSAVLVEGATALAAIGVDKLLGAANIVVYPVPALAFAEDMVSGVSLDAEGTPQLVLDPKALVVSALKAGGSPLAPIAAPPPILVIDDSLTTRILEQSILESAGYEVDLATSAEEGLEKARQRRYGLFLVDVEMPGMDGFSFIEITRADPQLGSIPAILVTSRNAPEDLARGVAVGASGHVVKGEFDQTRVLETIRRLLLP
jgi:two-component system, chemotaxis family, sensor kinase CheA